MSVMPRRFPPPWSVEVTPNCFIVCDANGQQLAYVYYECEPGRRAAQFCRGCHVLRPVRYKFVWIASQNEEKVFCYRPWVEGRMAIAVSALRQCKAKPLIASLAFCAVSATVAIAMDRGQFSKVPPEVREWFE